MSTVLVTGGAGFIGRHLVNDLLESDVKVRIVDSGETGQIEQLPQDCEFVVADIADLTVDDWDKLLDDVDVVYHLAARKYNTPGVTDEGLLAANGFATLQSRCRTTRDCPTQKIACAPGGIRTPNRLIRSQILYPLSYRRTLPRDN